MGAQCGSSSTASGTLPGFAAHTPGTVEPAVYFAHRVLVIPYRGSEHLDDTTTQIDPLLPPDGYTRDVIEAAINRELKGRLVRINREDAKEHEHDADPVAAVAAAQTTAISESRAAALADAPFSRTPTHYEPDHTQGRLF